MRLPSDILVTDEINPAGGKQFPEMVEASYQVADKHMCPDYEAKRQARGIKRYRDS